MLLPTSPELEDSSARPYFLWWTDATVADLRRALRDPDPDARAYWMGALLREANTRDAWLFVTPADIREHGRGSAVTSGAPGRCGPSCCKSTAAMAARARIPFHLGGGAALAGVHLRHRLSTDADPFVHDRIAHRALVHAFQDAANQAELPVRIVRDAGSFVRARVQLPTGPIEVDLVHDPVPDIEPPPPPTEGIQKHAGIDPGVLARLLVDFPVTPLPVMLVPLEPDALRAFRDDLRAVAPPIHSL